MKYALEYHQKDKNVVAIHFSRKLTEIIAPLDIVKSYYEEVPEGNLLVQDKICEGDYYTEAIIYDAGAETVGQGFKMMAESIYFTEGIRKIEIYRYEVILIKSPHFKWPNIINSVVSTVLLFLEPKGKATEIFFTCTKEERRKKKKKSQKPAEIYWKYD